MDTTGGYDIPPGEERMMVSVLTGFDGEGLEAEPIYEQLYLNRPANSIISEPLDYSESPRPSRNPDVEKPVHKKYHSERERLKTFEGKWKPEYHVTKEDLARDGFIYCGPKDRALCVFCLKSIRRWEANDNVHGEHKRLFPNCPWIQGKVRDINIPISQSMSFRKDMGLSAKDFPLVSDMKEKSNRLASFGGWPTGRGIAKSDLAKAGFFYEDNEDTLTCYHCGMKAPGWTEMKTLQEEHTKQFPNCPMAHPELNIRVQSSDEQIGNYVNSFNHQGEERNSRATSSAKNIEEDMQSPAVQAVRENFGSDYSMAEIQAAVKKLRLSKGSSHITSKDILETLDPDLVDMDT